MKNFPITVHYLEIFAKEDVNPKSVVRSDLKISKVKEPDPDGYVTVPDRPGIGFELNMDLLNRYKLS